MCRGLVAPGGSSWGNPWSWLDAAALWGRIRKYGVSFGGKKQGFGQKALFSLPHWVVEAWVQAACWGPRARTPQLPPKLSTGPDPAPPQPPLAPNPLPSGCAFHPKILFPRQNPSPFFQPPLFSSPPAPRGQNWGSSAHGGGGGWRGARGGEMTAGRGPGHATNLYIIYYEILKY